MLRVTAVVVRWRGGAEVHRCLASLVTWGGPHLAEVVLVDSGSQDRGADRLAVHFPEVRVLRLRDNEGFAAAANAGWAIAREHDAILIVNPDCVLPPGAVTGLAGFVASRPGCAGAVPRLVGPDGGSQHRWQLRRLPSMARLASGRSGAPVWTEAPPAVPAPVPQPAAACWLVRGRVWEALGGLDSRFRRAWWEDVDFCRRLRDSGRGALWVVPQVVVRHIGASSLGAVPPETFLPIFFGNLVEYVRRHHPRHLLWIRPALAASLLARGLVHRDRRSAYRCAAATVVSGPWRAGP